MEAIPTDGFLFLYTRWNSFLLLYTQSEGYMRVSNIFSKFWKLLKSTFQQWNERDPFSNSATIAYYTIFSLPGLLVIIINLAGYFFGEEAYANELRENYNHLLTYLNM